MSTRIVLASAPVNKLKGVACKDVHKWSRELPEALAIFSPPEHEATTTRDKPGHMNGNVKAIAGQQDEGQGTGRDVNSCRLHELTD